MNAAKSAIEYFWRVELRDIRVERIVYVRQTSTIWIYGTALLQSKTSNYLTGGNGENGGILAGMPRTLLEQRLILQKATKRYPVAAILWPRRCDSLRLAALPSEK